MRNRVSTIQNGKTGKQGSGGGLRGMYGSSAEGAGRSAASAAVSALPLYRINPVRTKLPGGQDLPVEQREIVKGRKIRGDLLEPLFPLQGLLELPGKITLRGFFLSILALAAIALSVILMMFNLKKTVIYGNTKYSQEQIESFITRGRLGDNTFVMALKYHHRTVTDIPFIDQIDIDLINASTVRVNIKEKEIAASILHNGRNVYISGEGIIQTISGRKAENTTQITGLTLTDTAMGEQIRAENQQGMNLSLELLNALNKYGIHADSIDVDDNNSLTVSFGNVRVRAGKGGYDQKMFKLHQIVPYLEGRSGIISMTGYNYNGENIVLYPFIRPEVTRAEAAVEAVKANGDEKVEQVKPVVKEEEEPASGTKKTDTKKQKMKQENKPEEVSGKKTSEKTTSEKTAPKKEISEKAVQEKAAPKKEASEKTAQEKTAPKKEASEKTVQEKAASKKEEPAKDTSEKKSGEADSEKEKQTNKEDAVKKNTAEKTEKIAETAEKTAENGSKMKENASKEDTTKKKVSED